MAQQSNKENLTVLDAVDNLTSMAELDIEALKKQGREALEYIRDTAKWLDIENNAKTKQLINKTFYVVQDYMNHIIKKESKVLKDAEVQKGMRAIMGLAKAAAERVDALYRVLDPKGKKSVYASGYRSLENFYQHEVIRKFEAVLKSEQQWLKEIPQEKGEEAYASEIRRLEEVKRDRDYELFYIRKENKKSFFSQKLLSHLKIITDFDHMVIDLVGDDPLIYVKVVQDRDAYVAASEILDEIHEELDLFLKEAKTHQRHALTQVVYKALLALLSASHRDNLITGKRRKTCIDYFRDFHSYLRNMVDHEDYMRLIDKKELDEYEQKIVNIVHAFCGRFFLHRGDQIEAVQYIKKLLERGQLKEHPPSKSSIWSWVLSCYDSINYVLRNYPSGPLMKTIDCLYERQYKKGFCPFEQDNYPHILYRFQGDSINCSSIRLPAPIEQKVINKAAILEEFRGFLRYLLEKKNEKLLIFNLQDNTSWKGHARSEALEKVQQEDEFDKCLVVVSIPKHTDFYHQSDEYLTIHEAKIFKAHLLEQIQNGRQCGFYFPKSLDIKKIIHFSKEAIEQIHKVFFGGKNVLTRKNRLDFIEVFYQLLELKLIALIQPTFVSHTCKDSVDVGASASFGLYGILKLLSPNKEWTEEEKDLTLRILFEPALMIRERNIDIQRLSRIISVLALIHAEMDIHHSQFVKMSEKLIGNFEVSHLEIYPSNY